MRTDPHHLVKEAALRERRARAYLIITSSVILQVVGSLGAILADAMDRGLVAQNVVRSRPRCRHASDRRKSKLKVGVDIPTPDEVRTLIAHLEGRWRPLFLTAIFTGLRASELRGLRWYDVVLGRGELHVCQRADFRGAIGRTKSEAGERTVPLPPIVVATLREWKLTCPKGDLGLVFPNGHGHVENHG